MILFLEELILFGLTQFFGILIALNSSKFIQEGVVKLSFTTRDFLVLAVLLIVFVFLTRKFSEKSAAVFKTILVLVIIFGTQTVLSLFFNIIVATLLGVLLAYLILKTKIVFIHNVGVLLATAGIGGIFGLAITPILAVLLLLVLSFYDIIAVYKTKHMVKLAEDMIKSRAIFGIVLPQNSRGWLESLENVRPGGKFMILGSGDIAMPLVLISSVVAASGLSAGLIVMLFSFVGLFLTHELFIAQRQRRPMAALPPIAALSIIGYLVSIIL